MQFKYTIIYVNDVVKTVDFYQKAFLLQLKFLHESNQYAEMQTGNTTLAFASESLSKSNGLNFRPNRLNQVTSGFEIAINAGCQEVSYPQKKPWEQMVAYVTDLNGILVEICESI